MFRKISNQSRHAVFLFTREWIEMPEFPAGEAMRESPSLRGSGLKSTLGTGAAILSGVSLFTREWIEMRNAELNEQLGQGLPLYEGVD